MKLLKTYIAKRGVIVGRGTIIDGTTRIARWHLVANMLCLFDDPCRLKKLAQEKHV